LSAVSNAQILEAAKNDSVAITKNCDAVQKAKMAGNSGRVSRANLE
jgi:hypothetical protein